MDGHLCGFLGVRHDELVQLAADGKSDAEILFATRFRPNPTQRRIWNGFARKFGWRDLASPLLETMKLEEGLADRNDLVTAFEIIDAREGRSPKRKSP